MSRSALARAAAIVGAIGCVLPAAACSSGSGTPGPSSPPPSAKPATTTPTYSQHPLPPAQSIGNDVALRKQVTLTGCAAQTGGWGASGTAANPGTKPARYTITVFFTTTTATVLNFATTTVTVPAGGKQDWHAAARFAGPKEMRCVLRGVA